MKYHDTDCPFCHKFRDEISHMLHPIFDTSIWKSEDFVVVPAMGSLVEGYLLIIPIRHYHSTASLPLNLLSDLSEIKSVVRRMLSEYFTSPVFFEHGPVCPTNRAGSCIDHAHLHCVPLEVDLVPRLRLSHELTYIDRFDDIGRQATKNQSYIYFENQRQEKFLFGDSAVPSQYIRRVIAEELGIPDQWDWAVFPFEQNAVSTLGVLKGTEFLDPTANEE